MENKKSTSPSFQKKREERKSRRAFMKKAAYSAPVLMALGQLAKPTAASADNSGGSDGPPGGGWSPN